MSNKNINQTTSFNRDINVFNTVDFLIRKTGINCIVETGTWSANTTRVLAEKYPDIEIYTIEIMQNLYEMSRKTLFPFKNVKCYLGSSEKVLAELLPRLEGKKILFYLDAHWYDYWPIKDELSLIGKYYRDNSLTVIDDIFVPNRNFQCDSYKGNKLSLEYIQNEMSEAYSDPFYFFNDKSNLPRIVGKIYIFPKSWLSYFADESERIWKEEGGYYYSLL